MNKKQLFVLWLCAGLIMLMCIFPPWNLTKAGPLTVRLNMGYANIFYPPSAGNTPPSANEENRDLFKRATGYSIDFLRLGIQIFAVALVGSALIYTLRTSKVKKSKSMMPVADIVSQKKISINCPRCGCSLKGVTQEMIGDTGICTKCKEEFIIEQKQQLMPKEPELIPHSKTLMKALGEFCGEFWGGFRDGLKRIEKESPKIILLTAIISGAICLVIGFGGGALLMKSDREKAKSAIIIIEAKAEKERTIAQQEIKTAKSELSTAKSEIVRRADEIVNLKQANDKLARQQTDAQQKIKTANDEIARLGRELEIATFNLKQANDKLALQANQWQQAEQKWQEATKRLVIGMTKAEVRSICGTPNQTVAESPFEIWVYTYGRVTFHGMGVVKGWE